MEFNIDAHIHSMYSEDSFLRGITPQIILERAILRGLDGIVITDARADVAFDKILKNPREHIPGIDLIYCDKQIALLEKDGKPIYLLRGIEHHDDKGHLLEIGGEKPIIYNPNYSLLDRVNRAHDNGSIIGPAHPFNVNFGGLDEKSLESIAHGLDFIEIFNALSNPKNNLKALLAAERYKLPGLANSDSHNAKPGTAYTVLDINADKETPRAGLIKMAIVQGKILGYHQEYTSTLEKLWVFAGKEILRGDFSPVLNRIRRFVR